MVVMCTGHCHLKDDSCGSMRPNSITSRVVKGYPVQASGVAPNGNKENKQSREIK